MTQSASFKAGEAAVERKLRTGYKVRMRRSVGRNLTFQKREYFDYFHNLARLTAVGPVRASDNRSRYASELLDTQ
jgi:hypothetical protein